MTENLPRGGPAPRTALDESVRAHLARGATRDAAEAALQTLGPAILRFMRSSLRDEALARDAFSEFSEDLLRGLRGFRGEASLRTWAYRLAWSAVARVRDDPWRCRRQPLEHLPMSALAEQIRMSVSSHERRALALERLRDAISFEDQSLLALRIDQGLPWSEIAQIVGNGGADVTAVALMKRFQRLKLKLAEMLRRDGLLED